MTVSRLSARISRSRFASTRILLLSVLPAVYMVTPASSIAAGRRFWGFLLKTSNYPRTTKERASLEVYSSSRDPQPPASQEKPSGTNLWPVVPASQLATHSARESLRLAQRVRPRVRLARRLAGRPLSPLHTYHATTSQAVERPAAACSTRALVASAQAGRSVNLSSIFTKSSPEIFLEQCLKN